MALFAWLRRFFVSYPPAKKLGPGERSCVVCGLAWQSAHGLLKDRLGGLMNTAFVVGGFSPASIVGLTCTRCRRSFCKKHLKQRIPSVLPGGSCPACGAKLTTS